MPYTPEEIARNTAETVRAKALATLRPIKREMQIMGWGAELQAAMWQAILRLALDRMVDAVDLAKRSGGPVIGREPVGAGQDVSGIGDSERSCPADPQKAAFDHVMKEDAEVRRELAKR